MRNIATHIAKFFKLRTDECTNRFPSCTVGLWEGAAQTGCPFLRYLRDYAWPLALAEEPGSCAYGAWIALEGPPPCRKKICKRPECHRYGKDYGNDRLLIARAGEGKG